MKTAAISAIIPIASNETMWRRLADELADSPADWEIIVAASDPPTESVPDRIKWLHCDSPGRASQMNFAAAHASGKFLWFVHADSRLSEETFVALPSAILRRPNALHYFDLRFYDGGIKMRANEFGVKLRCAIFKNPFGDQGLCIHRDNFFRVGGYPEDAQFGEDHLFVLRAQKFGVELNRVGIPIYTSARKYQLQGWCRIVFSHHQIWIRQFLAERKK